VPTGAEAWRNSVIENLLDLSIQCGGGWAGDKEPPKASMMGKSAVIPR
jgi:hypothetical protein